MTLAELTRLIGRLIILLSAIGYFDLALFLPKC